MRKLTVARSKSFVGCLGKSKLYIEDWNLGDTMINGTKCRYIGYLKNGETKSFEIEEQELKIYVIGDRLSKGFCNEYYQLPAGEEDIELTGGHKFNPLTGNAFRFDNNDSPEVLRNRKRNSRRGLVVLIIAFIVGFAIGSFGYRMIAGDVGNEKTFNSQGMSITLTDKFKEVGAQNFTVAYESNFMAVFALRESFSLMPGSQILNEEDYADLVIKANGLTGVEVQTDDDMVWIQYDRKSSENNKTYRYFAYMYKTDDAFWMVQFAVLKNNANKYEPNIREWAQTVEFD